MQQSDNSVPHYLGHRKRLKNKLLTQGSASFGDYELLELFLFQAIPRKDVKPLAKQLLLNFNNLSNLISADHNKILAVNGTNENTVVNIQIVRELIKRILAEQIINKHIISSWGAVLNYLKFNMKNLSVEQFRILFLNKKNILIADEILSTGTIDQTSVYLREIIKRALFHEAAAIILVHNHPSGDVKPSGTDVELTREIINACKSVNITVHDHVIIGKNGYYSFKSNMLL